MEKLVFYAECVKFGRIFKIYQTPNGFDAVIYDGKEREEGPELFDSRNQCRSYQEAFRFLVSNGLSENFQDFLNKKEVL